MIGEVTDAARERSVVFGNGSRALGTDQFIRAWSRFSAISPLIIKRDIWNVEAELGYRLTLELK